MTLATGDKLGPYEIVAPIGAGGMGAVYRARDARLGRDVAIKISSERFSERFEREARAVAALNHPNICHLYDVGVSDSGTSYLVMELVEGETLAARIKRGAIPLDEALVIARQITDALEAAHEKGITHRDLKPGNVMLRPEAPASNSVKVLDFGLAKVQTPGRETSPGAGDGATPENSPTLTIGMTNAGMILGTAAYMSPEQAKGKNVDKRADIWAFGVVLYEMLTGERPFHGEEVGDILASVIKEQPGFDKIPPQVRPLIESCLEKDPRKRLRDIGDAWRLLSRDSNGAGSAEASSMIPAPSLSRLGYVAWIAAGVFAASALALGFVHFRETKEEPRVTRFEIHAPEGSKLPYGTPAPSPDGRSIAYTVTDPDGATRIHVQSLDSTESRVLPGTEDAVHPFWSPDGRSLAFVSGLQLKRIDLAGGSPRTLVTVNGPWHGSWNQANTILFVMRGFPSRIPADGGPATAVAKLNTARNENNIGFPQFLRDGKRFLVPVGHNDLRSSIELATLGSFDRKAVIEDAPSAPIFAPAPNGKTHLLYLREQSLMAQEFDEGSGIVRGDPAVLVAAIGTVANPPIRPTVGVSAAGILAYQSGRSGFGQLAWFDRSGKLLSVLPATAAGDDPALSPDGKFAAVQIRTPDNSDIWINDLARGASTRFTFAPGNDFSPVWSPDGKKVVFHRAFSATDGIYEKDPNVEGQERQITNVPGAAPMSWTPNGRAILYQRQSKLFLLPLDGDKIPVPVGSANGLVSQGRISPDGKYIAYGSNESGRTEVYIQSLPPATGRWQVSVNGGGAPRWRGDGKELFFLSPEGGMMAVDVNLGASVPVVTPRELFQSGVNGITLGHYDVSKDGQKFLIYSAAGATGGNVPITVVLNWQAGLKK